MVDGSHSQLSIVRQCALLQISRSGRYYQPVGESEPTLALMRLIDEAFLECPYYGSRQMTRHLHRLGHRVGRNRVVRLMRKMGLRAIYQKPNTSAPHPEHRVYPYLLRELAIVRPNQVWCSDITYIPMRRGFPVSGGDHGLAQPPGAVVAAVEHHGRDVLHGGAGGGVHPAWHAGDLQHRPGQSIHQPGVHPDADGRERIRISMDGRGRWMDNVFIERLWRSLKYECVYLHAFETGLRIACRAAEVDQPL